MTTFAERVTARLARCDSPDDRRIGALAAIRVAVSSGRCDAEVVADVRAILDAFDRTQEAGIRSQLTKATAEIDRVRAVLAALSEASRPVSLWGRRGARHKEG